MPIIDIDWVLCRFHSIPGHPRPDYLSDADPCRSEGAELSSARLVGQRSFPLFYLCCTHGHPPRLAHVALPAIASAAAAVQRS